MIMAAAHSVEMAEINSHHILAKITWNQRIYASSE